MRFIASIIFAVFFQPTVTWELRESDCKDEYRRAVESCETIEDATDNVVAIKLCVENAKASYASCLDKCE